MQMLDAYKRICEKYRGLTPDQFPEVAGRISLLVQHCRDVLSFYWQSQKSMGREVFLRCAIDLIQTHAFLNADFRSDVWYFVRPEFNRGARITPEAKGKAMPKRALIMSDFQSDVWWFLGPELAPVEIDIRRGCNTTCKVESVERAKMFKKNQ